MKHLEPKISLKWFGVLLAFGILSNWLEAAEVSSSFAVTKGKGSLKRGETVMEMPVGTSPRVLSVGDMVSTAPKSEARISLRGEDAVELTEKTSVVLRKLRLSVEKRIITLALSLEAGTVKPVVRGPTKEQIKKEKAPTYDFQIMIGEAVVSGPKFVGMVVRGPKGKYTVDAYEGKPIVQHGKLIIQLASGVTVNPGPPMTVAALATNTEPIIVAYVGVGAFVLQPGQSIAVGSQGWVYRLRPEDHDLLEATPFQVDVLPDGRVRITNLSSQPLYAASWDGVAAEIPPGASNDFEVVEAEVEPADALAHINDELVPLLRDTFPDAFPPPVGAPPSEGVPVEILELPGLPREDQGGVVSPER